MRSSVDDRPTRFVWACAALIPALALGACGLIGGGSGPAGQVPLTIAAASGPEADYPVVVGPPFMVEGVTYTPEDVLNYDEVGFLAAAPDGGNAVSGSHHTLPLPSYVEVTSLDTGRTILVRVERRGPMDGHELLALSSGALAQLEAVPGAAVRVRRVNPPEDHRAPLRAGDPAPRRMDTPMPLVEVLRRKLPMHDSAALAALAPPPVAEPVVTPESAVAVQAVEHSGPVSPSPLSPLDPRGITVAPAAEAAQTVPADARPHPPAGSGFVVQAASFSTADRAQSAAVALGGEVSRFGQYFRVRTGPFATRDEAEASLAKVRAAGYRDARIFTSG